MLPVLDKKGNFKAPRTLLQRIVESNTDKSLVDNSTNLLLKKIGGVRLPSKTK